MILAQNILAARLAFFGELGFFGELAEFEEGQVKLLTLVQGSAEFEVVGDLDGFYCAFGFRDQIDLASESIQRGIEIHHLRSKDRFFKVEAGFEGEKFTLEVVLEIGVKFFLFGGQALKEGFFLLESGDREA